MKLLTAKQMQLLDRISINKIGIPGPVLMENAGRQVAQFIDGKLLSSSSSPNRTVYIFCGRGNNGGDGLVIARHLFNKGYKVNIFLAGSKQNIKGDAAVNLSIILNMGVEVKEITSVEHISCLTEDKEKKVIVDALLGTGAKGAPRGIFADLVEAINKTKGIKIAVDIPSGVDADTGEAPAQAVKADYTLTFAYPKRGLYLHPGMDYVGKVKVVDIGIPSNILEKENIDIPANLLVSEQFSSKLFYRDPSSHKGKFGHLLILAGSQGLTGAAALSCMGALRVGTGLVTLGIPASLNSVMEMKLTEVMSLPLPETDKKTLSTEAFKKISEFAKGCKAVVLGPGLSRNPETEKLVIKILKNFKLPLVLDADGINAVSGKLNLISNYQGPMVLTPHPGELARIIGKSIPEIQKDRINTATDFSTSTGKILVLKGAGTVVADEEGRCWVNTTGNPGMASGGCGDVLTGMIGGFLAQGKDVLTSAKLGVYIHGLAADITIKKQTGLRLLVAQDIVKNLIYAIRSVKKNEYR